MFRNESHHSIKKRIMEGKVILFPRSGKGSQFCENPTRFKREVKYFAAQTMGGGKRRGGVKTQKKLLYGGGISS